MRPINFFSLLVLIILGQACLLPAPPEVPPTPWTALDVVTETNIRSVHATPTELYLIADSEFVRLDANNEVLERRRLDLPFRLFGRPIVDDLVFVRMIRNFEQEREIEFHVARNKEGLMRVKETSLTTTFDDNIILQPEARNSGAFNHDGTKVMIATIRVPGNYYTFFIFDLKLNASGTEFISIEVDKRIDIPDFPADPENLQNIKYINGNYYITSLDGAYRITPEGVATQIFPGWKIDVFPKEDTLFCTGFENFNLHHSLDNGLSWTLNISRDNPTNLYFVDQINGYIINQQTIGFPYEIVNTYLTQSEELYLNPDFPIDRTANQNFVYFRGRYYLTRLRETYHACGIFSRDTE